ncbi:MAG: DUF4396 domain-containing protein [Nocardioidaceae bacterium]|nr:DUF4396 domain-containing protein [Nocardioidaceae bacterium]
MTSNVPAWLTPVAWVVVALTLASAAVIAFDVHVRRHRHATVASEVVWITSALYLGPVAVVLYRRHGRTGSTRSATDGSEAPTVVAGLPGGSASAIAHLIGVPLVLASGLTIAGIDLWVMIIVIGVVAIVLLAVHERTAVAGTRAARPTLGAAVGTAVVTVLAFDVGMVGWMLLLHYGSFMPPATDGVFWFLMQLGVLVGLLTGYPVVRRLAGRRADGPVRTPRSRTA